MRERLAPYLDQLRDWHDRLAPRERYLLYGASALSLFLLLWLGIYEPITGSIMRLDRDLAIAQRDNRALEELSGRYKTLEKQVSKLQKKAGRANRGSLFAQLESVTVPVVGREQITAMNPTTRDVDADFREESVDMKLSGVSAQRLVRLLHAIEVRSGGMTVARTSFKRQYKDPTLLDTTIVVVRLQPR
jgi:type II secretory pathway component PulM